MTRPYTEQDLFGIFYSDLVWRMKELSDLKSAIRAADSVSSHVLSRALIVMGYAHWEGYVRTCARRYFEHLTLRRKTFLDYERQIYINRFLGRLDALYQSRSSIQDRCALINDILDGKVLRFTCIDQDLIDTKSNLNVGAIKDICIICGVESKLFEDNKTFIDLLLLKRRNAIAHGEQEFIPAVDIDDFVEKVLFIMRAFRDLLENKVCMKAYAA
ncbi:MAG: MAE_28990/MAE_18760 family HEPN-like nuclease [Acidithiobacillus sp.]|uniref:MAE_28990/MAE_18760 family HEPN-like nuclease n=1 Tax=Acidithiobacillus sp. TaxID=1872118 RepID=UPI003CFC1628